MKNQTLKKKLVFSKVTVSNLGGKELNDARGGTNTEPAYCWTRYKDECMSNDPRYCIPTRFAC